MKKIKKTKLFLEAVVVIGIVFAFVMPVTAINVERPEVVEYGPKNFNLLRTFRQDGWIEQASGFWELNRGIDYMCAVDEDIAWATAYDGLAPQAPLQEFTKTTDGGELWEADVIFEAPEDGGLAMIFGLDELHAWVPIHSGDPQGIWHTDDGGETWERQATADYSGNGAFPNIVHFWDENNGWCQGDPVDGYYEMYTTTDGGENWVRVPSEDIPAPQSGEFGVVGYYDVVGDTVWFSTQQGRVFKSTDRGYTWSVYQSIFDNYMNIRFLNENDGLVWLLTASGYGDLAETNDGGETWEAVETSGYYCGYHFSSVPGTDATWISTSPDVDGNLGASYSLDGGHTWTQYTDDPVYNEQVLACDFIEGGIGWAGGFNEDEFTGGMYKYIPSENQPPSAPTIDGPSSGSAGESVSYTFTASDPDEDDVRYNIDWGDGESETTDYVSSGTGKTVSHVWTEQNTYTIKCRAEDSNGMIGPETQKPIEMPRSKTVNNFFVKFLQSYPNLFPILRHIFGL